MKRKRKDLEKGSDSGRRRSINEKKANGRRGFSLSRFVIGAKYGIIQARPGAELFRSKVTAGVRFGH